MPKRTASVTTNDALYHINVDQSISNLTQLLGIILKLIGGFCGWRDRKLVTLLFNRGVTKAEIGRTLGISATAVSKILSKSSSINLTDGSPSQAPGTKPGACVATSRDLSGGFIQYKEWKGLQ